MKDARAFGFPEEAIANLKAQLARSDEAEGDGVWPEHVAIVEAFVAVASQWRTASIGGGGWVPARLLFLGLDYTAARIGLSAAGIRVTPELWAGLRVMEAAACAALNDRDG